MERDEIIINGILHYDLREEWIPYSIEQLTAFLISAELEITNLRMQTKLNKKDQ